MTFQPGQSGNPKGTKKKDRLLSDTLRRALNHPDKVTGQKRVLKVVEAIIEAAENGDMAAAKLIGDRLEGKPGQEVEHKHSGSVFVEGLRQLDRERDMKVIEGETDHDTPNVDRPLLGNRAD